LARDLGDFLGCGGCLKTLRREKIGKFCVGNAKELDKISRHDIVPLSQVLSNWQCIDLPDYVALKIRSGDQRMLSEELHLDLSKISAQEFMLYAAESNSKNFLGVLERVNDKWQVALNF